MKFSKTLTTWYSENKRQLPWRGTQDPYKIWLSEIILQQTQVKQGLPYYDAFVSNFPTVSDLAEATEDTILKLWQGLGYYSRARNLHYAARTVMKDFQGEFPSTYKELITLKGIGDYTASAIASICADEPTAVVDGNVYRFLSRYFGIDTPINSTKGIKEFKALAQRLLPESKIGDHNQAMMEFGARHCKPSSPLCESCPFNSSCIALDKGRIQELPVKLKKTKVKKRYFNYLVFISDDKETLLEQRQGKGIWQNLYQFPLIESNASLNQSSLKEQLRAKDMLVKSFALTLFNEKEVVHKLSHQHLYTKFWIISVDQLPRQGVAIDTLHEYAVPVLISNFLERFNF